MSSELTGLQQKMAQLQQVLQKMQAERDRALTLAEQWRQRYEVEAQQHRRATAEAERTIASLRAELQQLCQGRPQMPLVGARPNDPGSQLTAVLAERDQLRIELEQEKAAHTQTRTNLINALNDALQTTSRGGLQG